MITPILIALLLSLGIISSESDYDNLSQEDKEYYQDIVIDNEIGIL